MSSNSVTLKTTVRVNDRDWHLFSVHFMTADGPFSTYLYALSREHAEMLLAELKETAIIYGQIMKFYPYKGDENEQ